MITQINDLPTNMVGFRASGEVTKEDFEPVLKQVEELVERTDKLNYLLVLDTSPKDFTAGAWLQDGLLGIKNRPNGTVQPLYLIQRKSSNSLMYSAN